MGDSDQLFVKGGQIVGRSTDQPLDIYIREGRIEAVASDLSPPPGCTVLDAHGKLVFPGLIDPQVHFREPGLTHKETIHTGSLAAIAGGVTSFMEMPNTRPATTTPDLLADKLDRAASGACGDHAFFLGATSENAEQLGEWENQPGCAGVKIFMGSSTGDLLVADDENIERVLRSGVRRVAVHSEDEERLKARYAALSPGAEVSSHPDVRDVECALRATRRLLDIVEKTGRKVHVLHLSTAEEVALIRERDLGDLVTAEITPNHLFLEAPECYQRWGSGAQMNPPVRDRRHREVLREALIEGTITCIGSDHAPHTAEDKAKPYPESSAGIPGVQTILPLLLTAVRDGWMCLEDILRVACEGPAQVYGIADKGRLEPGAVGDLVLVDSSITNPLPLEWLRSQAGYSPYEGVELAGWPVVTVLRGRPVYRDHEAIGEPCGRPLVFRQ